LFEPHGLARRYARLSYVGEVAAIALVYFAVARLSLMFASINPSASPIWPPAGLALAVILLRGYRAWPGVLLGAFAANATTAGTLATSAVIGGGNTLEALAGAWALNRWAGGRRAFESPTGVAKFAAIACLVGTPISATVGVTALAVAGFAKWASFGAVWTTWWLGDTAGALVVAPAVVLWAGGGPDWRRWGAALVDWAPVALLAAAVGLVAYSPLERALHASSALAFLALLPLMWAALRGSPRETAATAVLLSGLAVWGVLGGAGPFTRATLNESLLLLIAFVVSVSLPSLALSTALASRTRALESTEESLAEAREQLFQAQKMEAIGRLAGGIAHDFNNALAIVVGNLDLVLNRLQPDEARARTLVGNALTGAQRASALTQSLLAFSRQQPLDATAVDVNACVRDLSRLLAGALGETIAVRMRLAEDVAAAHIDRTRLESALVNLAVNARDAMPGGGELMIETSNARLTTGAAGEAADYVVVVVSDTGVGMSEETRARAFDPFFTTKAPGKGTGLGLSQVHGFVAQSGGHVRLESEPGRGASVKLYLPRAPGAPTADALAGREPPRRPTSSRPVLVVEDDPAVRDFACAALSEIGHEVYAAEDAAVGLELLDQHPDIGLVLTDVVMPDTDGRALAEAARRKRPDLPIVFMTGYARDALGEQPLAADALLIAKPFTTAQLAAKLEEAFG